LPTGSAGRRQRALLRSGVGQVVVAGLVQEKDSCQADQGHVERVGRYPDGAASYRKDARGEQRPAEHEAEPRLALPSAADAAEPGGMLMLAGVSFNRELSRPGG
jgi:hypothetical protein